MKDSAPSSIVPPALRPCRVLAAEAELREQLFGPHAGGLEHTFQSLFCARFHCGPVAYEQAVFRKCLYRRARLLAPLILGLKSQFFAEDFDFIRLVGQATSLHEVSAQAWRWRKENQVSGRFSRSGGRIRVSGRRVVRLARELFQGSVHRSKRSWRRARLGSLGRWMRTKSAS